MDHSIKTDFSFGKSYQIMTAKLNGFTSVQRLHFGEYTYKFTVNGKQVYVL